MPVVTVPPADGRREQNYLIAAMLVVFCVCAVLIGQRRVTLRLQRLQSYQISAFSDLSPREQGLFNDLYAAALELRSQHDESGDWMPPQELAAQGIPPFAAAGARTVLSWQANQLDVRNAPAVGYLGSSVEPATTRSMLLVMSGADPAGTAPHVHITVLGIGPQHKLAYTPEIWVSGAAHPTMPPAFDADTLGGLGWKQAVALKGGDARTNGAKP